jgi:predicted DNA-binding transcriptional regulator YafY
MQKSEIRTFRLDRISGEISLLSNGNGFEIPEGFDVFGFLENEELINVATIDIRKGKAHLLRISADACIDKGEWERITIKYFDDQQFVDQILWHGSDVVVIEPTALRNHVIDALKTIIDVHA